MKRLILALALIGLASGAWAQKTIEYTPPGVVGMTSNGTSITSTLPILFPDGTANAPSGAFASDADGTGTGFYRSAADEFAISITGTQRLKVAAGNVTAGIHIVPGTTNTYDLGATSALWRKGFFAQGLQGGSAKSLTDAAAATPVIRVPVATAGFQAGEVIWNAQSTDGTDHRTTVGRIRFADINKGGTPECNINVVGTDLSETSNANTLVCTWTNVVSTTNCDLSVTCTDNTAGTQTMTINVRVDMPTTALLTYP